MVDKVRKIFQSSNSEFLVDTYCGVGFFAIELANLAKKICWGRIRQISH
jgi:tRNA/tmRNA/rRNA uracil-C5-methylase (TrmA/RlmC/RlmD family)